MLKTISIKPNILQLYFSRQRKKIFRFIRLYSSNTKCENSDVKPVRLKKTTNLQQINNLLNSKMELTAVKHLFNEKLFSPKISPPSALYLIDQNVAETFYTTIQPRLYETRNPVLEMNPGIGLLTEKLMTLNIKHLYLYESMPSFVVFLEQKFHSNKVTIIEGEIQSINKLIFQDKLDQGSRLKDFLFPVEQKSWNSDPALTIIGAVSTGNFIKHLIHSTIFQNGVITYGRPELYVAVPPSVFKRLTSKHDTDYQLYRPASILFQLLFDFLLLEKIPRSSYLPWQSKRSGSKRKDANKLHTLDSEYLYIVKIEAKKILPVSVTQLPQLAYFIRHHLTSKKKRVIPELEKWVPGCCSRLLFSNDNRENPSTNINIYTEFGELSPQDILWIFKQFSSWPEYSQSPFLASVDSNVYKMEDKFLDDVDISVKEEKSEVKSRSEKDPLCHSDVSL